MKFEKIIKDVRAGKAFTDGYDKYRYNKRKRCVERWETDLRFIDRHSKPFWDYYCSNICLEQILLDDWEICDE